MDEAPTIRWTEGGTARHARWHSERGAAPPASVVIADDATGADAAYGLACQGTALLWRGDFQNARQLLKALATRADRVAQKRPGTGAGAVASRRSASPRATPASQAATTQTPAGIDLFNRWRQQKSQRARTLGMLLIELDAGYAIPLRRAPDVRDACREVYGPATAASVTSLRELQGLVGAHEWRVNGIEVPEAGGRIHPHYGVFAPIRREYVGLVANAPLPPSLGTEGVAFDIGTGTGVLAAVLARRGVAHVVATDQDARALDCARENITRLGYADRVEVIAANLFPPGRAALIVCNPPWLPARPSAAIEHGIYDDGSRMLTGFLAGLRTHLAPQGEGWLVLSDLAEHLGLRSRAFLNDAIDAAGMTVLGRHDVRPTHPRVSDNADPLHAARAAEVTSLWRLGFDF